MHDPHSQRLPAHTTAVSKSHTGDKSGSLESSHLRCGGLDKSPQGSGHHPWEHSQHPLPKPYQMWMCVSLEACEGAGHGMNRSYIHTLITWLIFLLMLYAFYFCVLLGCVVIAIVTYLFFLFVCLLRISFAAFPFVI